MKYVSERVINISELEELIRLSYHAVVAIRNELDKQRAVCRQNGTSFRAGETEPF